ncbi:flagellar assembly protein FliH [Fontimonas thermophila]|uniref:Flagellar assembly protein FliH n=1 Tax=Fontimonas thermophila TaxID=1076937 RepID=A0A1I2IPW2_9GAMM|nr:flagellar assembly protein FliH [Fontimonas thermophila]SFF43740.1 flagellar assembly protein FliH [Fontimonas thermophila]
MTDAADAIVLPAEAIGGELPRWQLPRFDAAPAGLHTAAQLEAIEAAAYQEGFARGHAEGFDVGQRAALAQAQRLQGLIDHIARPLAHLDDEVEHALVDLAAAIARRIIHDELRIAPERIVAMVRETLAALPAQLRNVRLRVHPDDAALLREHLSPPADVKELEIIPDPELKRGDCRVFTESALIDARLDRRVRVIAQALSGDSE